MLGNQKQDKMKKKKIDALDRKGNFRHEQHTEKFYKELNTPINKKLQPFRHTDNVMMIGKYKGQKVDTLPKGYIEWILKNYIGLSNGTIQKLKKLIKDKS